MDDQRPVLTSTTRRKRHSLEFKTQVLAECGQPGISVAFVARRHGINQNLIHNWRRSLKLSAKDTFVRLPSAPTETNPPSNIRNIVPATVRIELPSPAGLITIHWPLHEIRQSTTWLKALIR